MLASIKFFYANLSTIQITFLVSILYLHISSHINHMLADKLLIKNIPKILSNTNDNQFSTELFNILIDNLYYLIIYAVTMLVVESICKLAIKNAITKKTNRLLNADLSKISKQSYEHEMTSVVHHAENVTSAIRNLFIEFPRKIVACHHFLLALTELSRTIMVYCTMANILFVVITIGISYVRKNLISKIVESNIKFSMMCSDLSNSIQSYKVDNRINEYQRKIYKITSSNYYNSSMDSVMVASTDAITSFSSQFMVGLISYMCRPMVINHSISIEDLMYGIRSSSKFVEKMIGILEYFSDVIRQYKSFSYFNFIDSITIEPSPILSDNNINHLVINGSTYKIFDIDILRGHFIRITGSNGVGKTTLLQKFMGINYKGAITSGKINIYNDLNNNILPYDYRNKVAFVQQNIPITYDTVTEYILATANHPNINWSEVLHDYDISLDTKLYIYDFFKNLGYNKPIRELSGGQSKMVQIMAAIAKLYYQGGYILVLDEPSNNLDLDKIDHLKEIINKLLDWGITILIITHDKRILNDQCITIELV